jgi:hypothetical protein
MPGLVPASTLFGRGEKAVDGRDKPGHDEDESMQAVPCPMRCRAIDGLVNPLLLSAQPQQQAPGQET